MIVLRNKPSENEEKRNLTRKKLLFDFLAPKRCEFGNPLSQTNNIALWLLLFCLGSCKKTKAPVLPLKTLTNTLSTPGKREFCTKNKQKLELTVCSSRIPDLLIGSTWIIASSSYSTFLRSIATTLEMIRTALTWAWTLNAIFLIITVDDTDTSSRQT